MFFYKYFLFFIFYSEEQTLMNTFEWSVIILLTLILLVNFYFYTSIIKMFTTKSGWLWDLLEGIQDDIRNK